jgi:hemerythrin-like domain-containing protein
MTATATKSGVDLATYHAIHTCLREAGFRLAASAARLDPHDHRTVRALTRYWDGYTGEVNDHHTVEDDIFFPALVEKAPMAGDFLERIHADHHLLDELGDAGSAAITDIAAGGDPARAVDVLGHLATHMAAHLDFEDRDVLPLFPRYFDGEEYGALEEQASKILGISRQALFTVPFIGWFITPEERKHLLGGAPLAFRVLYHVARPSHARLARRALGA